MTRTRRVAVGAALAAAGLLSACNPRPPWAGPDARAQGERLFIERGCHGCHTVGLLGTPTGPDLSDIGARSTRAELAEWLEDPRAHSQVANMPRITLTDEEVRLLATYLASLDEDQPDATDLTSP